MKYNFLKINGDILETNNPKRDIGFDWNEINRFGYIGYMTKEEKEWLDKYKLPPSRFNLACLDLIHMVFLFPNDLKRLKGGNNENGIKN
jgi:hypothetical protein